MIFLNGGRLAAEGLVHTLSTALTLNNGGTIAAATGAGWTMPAEITGAGALTVDGGSVTFQAAADNTYTGLTTVRSGTLNLKSSRNPIPGDITVGGAGVSAGLVLQLPDQLPDISAVTILAKGAFDLNNNTETVAEAVLQAGTITGGSDRLGVLSVVRGLTTLAAAESSIVSSEVIFIGDASRLAYLNVAGGEASDDLVLSGKFSLDDINKPALIKTGQGSAVCSGSAVADVLRIDAGSCVMDAVFNSLEISLNGGSLAGSGTVGRISAASPGGSVSPGPGTKNLSATAPVSFNAATSLPIQLNGTVAGTSYDRLTASSTVALGNAVLNVSLGFLPNDRHRVSDSQQDQRRSH